jgi:hypothetical protein
MSKARGDVIVFARGRKLFQIARAYDAEGFVGVCDGRVVARASNKAAVARALIVRGD